VTSASVIVCTHDRGRLLPRCIESVAAQRSTASDVEIVIVDNASTDGTAAVVRDLQQRFPGIRSAYEPTLGLSRARNHGIEVATGELLLFIDDDAVAGNGWIDAMLGAYDGTTVSGVAGKIELDPTMPRPWWFVPDVEPLFSGLDLGDAPRLLAPREWPFGTNMSVRRDVAVELGGFPEQLGRVGADLLSNEETAFFEQLTRRGQRIAYEPRAVVVHALPRDRLTLRYLSRRAYAQGRSEARLHELLAADGGSWFDGRPSRAVARASVRGWRSCVTQLAQREERRGVLAQQVATRSRALGFAVERSRRPAPSERSRPRAGWTT
jgi:glycosyltransferase involved in cell wall biosynthesis